MLSDRLQNILVHEHIFTETGPPPALSYLIAGIRDVVEVMSPLVNTENDRICIDYIQQIKNHNFSDKILISMDSEWYNPRYKNGGSINGYVFIRLFFTEAFEIRFQQSGNQTDDA